MPQRPTSSSSSSGSRKRQAVLTPDARRLTPVPDELAARAARVKSNIRKILLTNPAFPRLYADVALHYSPNSHEAKILRPYYQKFCEKVNAMSTNGTCTHIKVTGVRCGSPALSCGSPALKGEEFCYFHQNAIRSVRRPKQSRLHPIAMIEDEESIQYALMEVINALMKNTIDLKRATLILRALHIAVKNASRVKFAVQGRSSVSQIPEYAPAPDKADFDETAEIDLPYNAWIPPKSERQVMDQKHRAQKLQDWKAQQAQHATLPRPHPQPHSHRTVSSRRKPCALRKRHQQIPAPQSASPRNQQAQLRRKARVQPMPALSEAERPRDMVR